MYYKSLIGFISLLNLAIGLPASEEDSHALSPRCGTFKAPAKVYFLYEASPNFYAPQNNLQFQVYQQQNSGGGAKNRIYALLHFDPTPFNSYGCQLSLSLPSNPNFAYYYGAHQLDVKTVTSFNPGFHPTWNNVVNSSPSILGSGVFGTVNFVPDVSSVVNTEQCSNSAAPPNLGGGFGLNFLFKFSDWVEQAGTNSGVKFLQHGSEGNWEGTFLTYNC